MCMQIAQLMCPARLRPRVRQEHKAFLIKHFMILIIKICRKLKTWLIHIWVTTFLMTVFDDSINRLMAFIYYVLELQRSMQKYLVRTTDAKKGEEEVEHTETSDLRNVSSCENIKSLSWNKWGGGKSNQIKPGQCSAAVHGAEAVICCTSHCFMHCSCSCNLFVKDQLDCLVNVNQYLNSNLSD